MKNKGLKIFLMILGLLIVVVLAGPRMPKPKLTDQLPDLALSPDQVKEHVAAREASLKIRPGNESRVIWYNDTLPEKTDYVLLYLHGFSASPMEGDPVHELLARKFGMNAYIPLLCDHGLETEDALLNMSPENLWASALDALAVARNMGKKVIIVGTSTGGTLALRLARDFQDMVYALILYSPNVRVANKAIWITARPWGLSIARMIMGGEHRVLEPDPETDAYWYSKYRVEGLVYLQQLVEATMKASVFEEVTQPAFIGYYYKDDENQDQTVSVEAILWMAENLGTPDEKKSLVAFPDAGAHVIACSLTNPNWMAVFESTSEFIENTLGIQPKH